MNSSNEQYYINLIYNLIPNLYKYAGSGIYIISTLGNLISISIFLKKSWKKNVCVFYLTCYLIWSLCFMTTFMIADILNYSISLPLHKSNNIICKIYHYIFYLSATLAPNVLIFASIDRFLLSSRNIDARLYSSKRLAYFSLGISSCLWALYYLHIPIKSSIQKISSTNIDCIFEHTEPYISFIYYSLIGTNFIACFIIAILVILSFKNIRFSKQIPREQRDRQIRTMKKKDFQLLRCLCVIDIIYAFFSMLSLSYDIYYAFSQTKRQTLMEQAIYFFLSRLFTLLLLFPYAICFWIFIIVSKAFRQEIYRIFSKICMRRRR